MSTDKTRIKDSFMVFRVSKKVQNKDANLKRRARKKSKNISE